MYNINLYVYVDKTNIKYAIIRCKYYFDDITTLFSKNYFYLT